MKIIVVKEISIITFFEYSFTLIFNSPSFTDIGMNSIKANI